MAKPIRKTHQFYNTSGNLWDNAYLTSPKIAKFYHKANQSFVETHRSDSGRVEGDVERSKGRRVQSLLRQRVRRAEREELEARTKGNSQSTDAGRSIRTSQASTRPQVSVNEWQRLDHLPRRKLTQFITPKCVEMDEWAKNALLDLKRRQDFELQTDRERDNRRREQQREALLTRHVELRTLEEKAGVVKVHSPDSRKLRAIATPFGQGKAFIISSRFRSLSRPKAPSVPRDPLAYSELKGLLVCEHREAIDKVKRSQSSSHPLAEVSVTQEPSKPAHLSENESKQVREDIATFTEQLKAQSRGFCGKDLEQVLKKERKIE